MANGWSDPTRMQVINFMIYCKGKTVFLKFVNASSDKKEHKYLAKLFKDVINEVGRENVVQIVLALMRKVCKDDLIRLGPTQFSTNYISLQSLFQKNVGLKQLFICNDWVTSEYCQSKEGRRIEELVLENMFWDNVQSVISIYKPLYGVLRIVDIEVNPTMPMLYDLFKKVGTKLEQIRNTVWYSEGIGDDPELLDALHSVFAKLDPNSAGIAQFGNEIINFRDSLYKFGRPAAIASRKSLNTYEWWNMYGGDTPTLRKLAMKILSQTTSSSACEQNWFEWLMVVKYSHVKSTASLEKKNDIGEEETADSIYHWKEVRDHYDESDGSGYKLSRGTNEKSIDDDDDDDGNTGGGSSHRGYGGSGRDNSCDNGSYDYTNREANYGNDRGSSKS
ncbi:uncharacterized protein LOC133723189 [Rosa rugosa]|uniref:uncharacterized protein LOC133723189 n=1 Tax=Rosa rugosa TaxID=74645 RepID=UPI002B415097|nr:uncharacterized protein LOC133723189 [Rosa rugosa]